jgi:hypothetical protein
LGLQQAGLATGLTMLACAARRATLQRTMLKASMISTIHVPNSGNAEAVQLPHCFA